jgi:ABC-2 type transport system ATP-binding protein
MPPIVTVNQLSKHFRVFKHQPGFTGALRNLFWRQHRLVKAVNQVSFAIQRGELVGYLGPNGAGKSTTLKMLTGLLAPTSGEIVVNGYVPWKQRQAYVSGIGAVFGQRTTLWWDLPVSDSLDMLQYLYRIPSDRYRRNRAQFQDLLELDAFINTPVRALSLGQRMRADLCAAMLHDPPLLFLDEPTIGLDVVAKERIRQFIRHIHQERQTTIILTTHDLSDVEKLCRRVMIIDQGSLLYDGELETLKQRFGGKRQLVVDFAEYYEDPALPPAEIVSRQGLRVVYAFERDTISASALISQLSALSELKQYRIVDLGVREPDIESTIRRIYEGRLLQTEYSQ